MQFEDFYSQSALIEALAAQVQSGQFMHAYLFVGEQGAGKRSLARLCVQAIFCKGEPRPCGQCENCRRILGENHPDVYEIREEKRIGVDRIRELTQTLKMRPYFGGPQAVVIEGADTMTAQAQNALLKTLEEPPPETTFFLLADAASQLLPTIRSRCVTVSLGPLAEPVMAGKLRDHKVPEDRIPAILRAAGGVMGKALRLAEDESYFILRGHVLGACQEALYPADILRASAQLKDFRPQAADVMNLFEGTFSDGLRFLTLGERPGYGQTHPALMRFVEEAGQAGMLRLLGQTLKAKKMLNSNVSYQSVTEHILLSISEENEHVHGHRHSV